MVDGLNETLDLQFVGWSCNCSCKVRKTLSIVDCQLWLAGINVCNLPSNVCWQSQVDESALNDICSSTATGEGSSVQLIIYLVLLYSGSTLY